MISTLPLFPVWLVDMLGSALMIIISFVCVRYAQLLRRTDKDNVIWTYLLWLCLALALFSVSRSVGHIAKRLLLLSGQADIWVKLRPFSGSVNSLMFVIVGSITLFFQRVNRINLQILNDKKAIEKASEELMWLNRNLEDMVRQRTDQLSKSEEKYRRIFEGSMDIILVLDSQGRFLDINQAGLSILGYASKDELASSTTFADLLDSHQDPRNLLKETATAGFRKDLECNVRNRDGGSRTWLFSLTARRKTDGKLTGFEGIAKDITHRKKMEEQLLQADRLASLGELSAGVAHEVNNPLGMILGYTQLLLRSEPEGTQDFQDLKIIEKHARNCKAIVEDLLNFARSSETQKGVLNVNDLLREVVSVVEHQFKLDNVTIKTHLGTSVPMLCADGEKLKQVFMNLLMNAKQAIEEGGQIQIITEHDSSRDQVTVTVADTGSGIPPEVLEKIFDPFFTTKPTGQGTGLGLSVSYGIIKDHLGDIHVQSTPGEGSTFIVTFSVSVDDQDEAC
ncbi:MAG: PAS domain S-box protein [Deltaproteobacteria bacterium]|nr:MAG: PAS domain S-box protein [Deltaproteobacteria bacterium]